MQIKVFILVIVFSYIKITNLKAQEECDAKKVFEITQCSDIVIGPKCITLNVIPDTQGIHFNYEWVMGDGAVKKGEKIEHCYDHFGTYVVSLNLIDPSNNNVIFNEVAKQVTLDSSLVPFIEIISKEVVTGIPIAFKYGMDIPSNYEIAKAYWDFGDDEYSCDAKPVHVFNKPNTEVKLMLIGKTDVDGFEVCVSKKLALANYNIDGVNLRNIFDEKENKLSFKGRFLEDNVHYMLVEKGDKVEEYHQMEIIEDKYTLLLNPERDYTMYAWKGNLFTESVSFSTAGVDGEALNFMLKQALDKLFASEPLHFENITFINNKTNELVDGLPFDANVKLLNDYKNLKIEVGFYTHTKGRPDANLKISNKRADYIKNRLISEGISENRITMVTAETNYSLLNSCYGIANCDMEDESLNLKANFKIISIETNQNNNVN